MRQFSWQYSPLSGFGVISGFPGGATVFLQGDEAEELDDALSRIETDDLWDNVLGSYEEVATNNDSLHPGQCD